MGNGERGLWIRTRARNSKPLPAGDEDDEMPAPPQRRVGEVRAGRSKMLRIVQHQQKTAGLEVIGNGSRQVLSRLLLEPEDIGHRLWHETRIGQGRELYQPSAVRIGFQQVARHLHGQACLAAATRARKGEQPRRGEQLLHLCDLLLAPDEARQLLRQVVSSRCRLGAGRDELQREPIAPYRDGRDRIPSQDLAQRGYVRLQGILFDDRFLPYTPEQLVLGYSAPVVSNQP